MNQDLPGTILRRNAEAAQTRFALRLTAALSEHQALGFSPDIGERLRFAREQALAVARQARSSAAVAAATAGRAGGAAVLAGGPESNPWWLRLGSLLPLAVLLAGLVLIDNQYTRAQIDAAVEVDAAILADDVPPEAYRDRGFVEYLRSARP